MPSAKEEQAGAATDFTKVRLEKLETLRGRGIDPYPAEFHVSATAEEVASKYAGLEDGVETEDRVTVAGRVHSSRNNGMFMDIRDGSGKIQIFSHKDCTDAESLQLLPLIDLGDFIGVEGLVRRTKRGELTVNAEKITILVKSLLPMPEKYHGLKDVETRLRNRHLDLIGNETSRETFRLRSKSLSFIRRFMEQEGFMEIETPVLHAIYGGAAALPFRTHYNAVHRDMYLRIALELHLKRTLVGGLADKLFEIGRVFRNEGISTRHNPEFTMLEAYWAYADYTDIMTLVENLFSALAKELHGSHEVQFGDTLLDFSGPFRRLPMPEAVKEASGIDFLSLKSAEEARQAVRSKLDLEIEDDASWGELLEQVFEETVEPGLVQPVHITHFPKDTSPLAKSVPEDRRLVYRFETFCNTWEIANAFSELNDPVEQRRRMEEQVEQAHQRGEKERALDEEFLSAIEQGMPPTGGLGIGIDRLIMLLTDSSTIRDVILFPALRAR